MATTVRLDTKGIARFFEEVSDIEGLLPQAVNDALLEGGELVRKEMYELAPEDSGNLLAHIKIKGPTREGTFITIEIGLISDIEYTDAETARYGNVMEYGSSSVKPRSYIRAGTLKSQSAWRNKLIEILKSKTGMDFK